MIHYLLLSLIRTSGAVFVYVIISLFRGPKYIFIITYFHLQIKVTTTSANKVLIMKLLVGQCLFQGLQSTIWMSNTTQSIDMTLLLEQGVCMWPF